MVWILPPSNDNENNSYDAMYKKILSTHRRAGMSASAASVVMLVATNVDALCAARLLITLFKHDDIGYTLIPVSGRIRFKDALSTMCHNNTDLHSLLLIDMGGNYDLPQEEYLGTLDAKVTVHVIDSARPYGLDNLFTGGQNGERFVVWDDGGIASALRMKESWEAIQYEPPESDEDGSDTSDDDADEVEEDLEDASDGETEGESRKRRRLSEGGTRKRQKLERRLQRQEFNEHVDKILKFYDAGAYYGRSLACIMYTLSVMLEREDDELLWLAILGLTFQYISSRISHQTYENERGLLADEVARLNPRPADSDRGHSLLSVNPGDGGIRSTTELRFTLLRHWTLYDAMMNSSFVASRLALWTEKGRNALTGLLAKMGLSILQAQQSFSHMDMDLKKNLIEKLEDVGPEHGLTDHTYDSFMKLYGFHSQPLSAADAVEGLDTLLEVAEGIRLEVEIEGTRNGGEWFGIGRIWQPHSHEKTKISNDAPKQAPMGDTDGVNETQDNRKTKEVDWWERNFWTAYDALGDIKSLRKSLDLAMTVHRAIHRTGTAVLDRHTIKKMRNHHVVILDQGPDIQLFCHYGMLRRLALWLIEALRDRLPVPQIDGRKEKTFPIIVACLNELKSSWVVVGVSAAFDFGNVQKNRFATSFMNAIGESDLHLEYGSFDCSVVEIAKDDLKVFLAKVCAL